MIIQKEWEIFEIRVRKGDGYEHGERVRIAGERASFEGFEDFSFAVDGRVFLAYVPWDDGDGPEFYQVTWIVTELTSGFQVCTPKDTKDEALAEAQRVLNLKGADVLRQAIAKALEMVGAQ